MKNTVLTSAYRFFSFTYYYFGKACLRLAEVR